MAVRDELYEWVDVTTFSDLEPQYIRGRRLWKPTMWYGSGSPSATNAESTWDYVEDQPMSGYWECQYCGSLYPQDVLKCSQCGAHKRKGQ